MNLEHPPTIMAIIGDMMFLGKQEEGEYVGDVIFVDIYFVGTKISDIVGRHNSLAAVNLDGMCSWANIVDVSGLEKRLTVLWLSRRRKFGSMEERPSWF